MRTRLADKQILCRHNFFFSPLTSNNLQVNMARERILIAKQKYINNNFLLNNNLIKKSVYRSKKIQNLK